jgi:transcriptional regulator with XRE-family HTH domain
VVSETFGARLRRLRRAQGLSQTALAGQDLHPSYVSLLEADRREPTSQVVDLLSRRLGVPAATLRGDDDPGLATALAIAEASLGLGRPTDALDELAPHLDRLHDPAALTADDVTFRAATAAATAYENLGRYREAATLLAALDAAATAAPHRLPFLDLAVARVRVHRDAGDLGYAVEVGETAVASARSGGLELAPGYAALVSTLAGAYAERGDLLRGQLLLDELRAATDAHGTDDDRAMAAWNAAISAAERGFAADGLRLAVEARELLTPAAGARAAARITLPQAWLLLAQDPPRPDEAREILRAAMPALRQYAGNEDVASAETELARCELLLGRPDVARRHASAALTRMAPDQRVERARALAALGAAFLALDERAAGIDSLEDAAGLLGELGASRQAAAVWRQLVEAYRRIGDTDRALTAAERALSAAGVLAEPLLPPEGTALAPARKPRARARSST